jgi:hypothetical protein
MKILLTGLLLILISVIVITWQQYSPVPQKRITSHESTTGSIYKAPSKEFLRLKSKASAARSFIKQNNFDTTIFFLVDMTLPAGKPRFFVYDLKRDLIQSSGLVTHGNCNQYWLEGRKYGNEIGCGCTSIGKYKIGKSYHGKFGLAFKLHGLEQTNSNAFKRYVVLHSHNCVPESEVADEICQSNGCPTVAPGFLKQLELLLKKLNDPVLLWIFE